MQKNLHTQDLTLPFQKWLEMTFDDLVEAFLNVHISYHRSGGLGIDISEQWDLCCEDMTVIINVYVTIAIM